MLTKITLNCLPVNQEARIGCFNDSQNINNNNNNNSNNNFHQKRGAVCQNHLRDQKQNLIRTLEICVCLS